MSPVRSRAPRWPRLAAALAVVLLSAGALLWHWSGSAVRIQPDSWWYARGALIYSGSSQPDAEREASWLICRGRHPDVPAVTLERSCRYPVIKDPRYARIFTARPLYPLLAAPLVHPLGGVEGAMTAVTALCCVVAGAFMYASVRRSGGGRVAGLAAVVALGVLPSGYWMARLTAEAPMMAGLLAVVWGLVAWPDSRAAGLAAASLGSVWVFLAKPADGLAFAVALLAAAVVARVAHAPDPEHRTLVMAAVGAAGVVGWEVASAVLRVPGLGDAVQDLATHHYATPDVAHPWRYLLGRDLHLISSQTRPTLRRGWPLLLGGTGLVALIALVVQARWRSLPWLAAGATGIAAVAVHPLVSEYQRLAVPLCLPVEAGLGLLCGQVASSLADRARRGPESRAAADR
jgi:hypothetical protein